MENILQMRFPLPKCIKLTTKVSHNRRDGENKQDRAEGWRDHPLYLSFLFPCSFLMQLSTLVLFWKAEWSTLGHQDPSLLKEPDPCECSAGFLSDGDWGQEFVMSSTITCFHVWKLTAPNNFAKRIALQLHVTAQFVWKILPFISWKMFIFLNFQRQRFLEVFLSL